MSARYTPRRDWQVNVLDYGAKGDNTSDDYAAITAAIAACPAGGVVLFPPGQYVVTNTITIPDNITLRGSIATRWPQYGGIPVYIKPKFGSFLGSAVLSATETDGWRLENLTLQSGRATGPAGVAVDGLYVAGACKAVRIANLMVNNMSGYGIHTDSTATGWPGGWEVSYVNIMNCLLGGWRSDNTAAGTWAFSDSTLIACEAGANSGDGWYWAGTAAVDLLNVRSTFNGGYGFAIVGLSGSTQFTACQTDRSIKDGFLISAAEALTATYTAPHSVSLVNCTASRDGKNNDSTAGGYAGVRVVGTSTSIPAITVLISNLNVHLSRNDNGTGLVSPDYGVLVSNGRKVMVSTSLLGGTVAPVSDNGTAINESNNTKFTVNGTTGAVTYL